MSSALAEKVCYVSKNITDLAKVGARELMPIIAARALQGLVEQTRPQGFKPQDTSEGPPCHRARLLRHAENWSSLEPLLGLVVAHQAGRQTAKVPRSQGAACRQSRQIQEKAQDYSGFGFKTPNTKYTFS
jgi:hypothetical protein